VRIPRVVLIALAGWLWADVLLTLFVIFAVANTASDPAPTPTPRALLEISVYNDADSNGVRTANEPGLAGWTLSIGGPMSPPPVTTDLAGRARLSELLPGTYTVTEAVMEGWRSTDPPGPIASKIVTIAAGRTASVSFGNHQLPPPPSSLGVDKTPIRIVVRTGDLNLLGSPRDLESRQQIVIVRTLAELGGGARRVALINAFGRHANPSDGERLAEIGTAHFSASATPLKDVVVFTYHSIVSNDSGSAIDMDVYFYND
jgi:hypothetical protein